MPVQFDNHLGLLLLIFIAPTVWFGWRRLTGMSRVRRAIVCSIRSLVIILIALAIAQPKWADRGEALTVMMLIDRSRSISPQLEMGAIDYLRLASESSDNRRQIDRLAIINIGAEARVRGMPDTHTLVDPGTAVVNLDATNLADGLRKAMAIAPKDTAVRIILVSDGNENVGNATAVANIIRSNGIPIDVLGLKYEHQKEVLFDRIVAPSHARKGQNITVNMVLRSQQETTGTIHLRMNDNPIDLDPDATGTGLRIALTKGINSRLVTVPMDQQGANRFKAEFMPDTPDDDAITSNNRQETVVIVQGEGRVLVIDESDDETASLRQALAESNIDVTRVYPYDVPTDLLTLSAFDSIIVANVPAHAFPSGMLEALRVYVHDVGGGLVMIGGPDSFGAGGWIGTPTARAIPLRLDPPDKEQMPKGALVLIMHSTEVAQGNYWGAKCAESAVNALSRLDLVGILDYGFQGGCTWEYPLQELGDKSAALSAIKKMAMGDMPDFTAAMNMTLTSLKSVNSSQKHVIIISDGDPSPPSAGLLQKFKNAGITITTVVCGGHGSAQDAKAMRRIATVTGGKYYNPKRVNQMPQIFWKEAITVRRSLRIEGDIYSTIHKPTVRPGPFNGKWGSLPPMTGYILTAPKPGYEPEIVSSLGDPVMAHWQYGLGKSVAFTTDATSRWGSNWVSWGAYQAFWEQIIAWSMRPGQPPNMTISIQMDGNRAIVQVELLTSDNSYATFGKMDGMVLTPGLDAQPITVHQTGPGRGQAEFRVNESGTWVVNLLYDDPESGRRSMQAGVSIPFSQEYRNFTDNMPLLTQLAEQTGGKVLPSDPANAHLFDRENLNIPLSLTDMWPLIAIIAASMFLIDVGARRLSIDPIAIRRRWVEMLQGRGASATESMGRLKETRAQVQDRLRRNDTTDSKTRFDVESDVTIDATDFNLDAETAANAADAGATKRKKPTIDKTAADANSGGDDGSYTSRLLAAKKRAQQNQSSEDERSDDTKGGSK